MLLKAIAQQNNCSFLFVLPAHLKLFYLIPSCVRDLVFLFLLKYIALLVLKEMNCFGTGLIRLRSFLRKLKTNIGLHVYDDQILEMI